MKTHHHILVFAAVAASAIMSMHSYAWAGAGSQAFDKRMQPILKSYLVIHSALAADSTKGVQTEAKAIAKASKRLKPELVKGEHASHYKDIPKKLTHAAMVLAKAKNLEAARAAFNKLSQPMAMWGTMAKPAGIAVVYCSMAKGSWLQKGKAIRNPYYGASMLSCGQIVGGALHSSTAPDGHGAEHGDGHTRGQEHHGANHGGGHGDGQEHHGADHGGGHGNGHSSGCGGGH